MAKNVGQHPIVCPCNILTVFLIHASKYWLQMQYLPSEKEQVTVMAYMAYLTGYLVHVFCGFYIDEIYKIIPSIVTHTQIIKK